MKMNEIKKTVEPQDRMQVIGNMWKQLPLEDRKPYVDQSLRYNQRIDVGMKDSNWETHRKEIVRDANICAGVDPETVEPVGCN